MMNTTSPSNTASCTLGYGAGVVARAKPTSPTTLEEQNVSGMGTQPDTN